MATFETIKGKLAAMINDANDTTGGKATTLKEAFGGLRYGFGEIAALGERMETVEAGLASGKEELDRLNGVLPSVTAEDAGKALVVSEDGRIVADDGMIEQDVLAEQVLKFIGDPDLPQDPYAVYVEGKPMWSVTAGETYYVVWDGVTYNCTAFGPPPEAELPEGYVFAAIGNISFIEGDDTGEPFIFAYESYEGEEVGFAYTNSPDLTLTEVSHTVRIYQIVKGVPYYTKSEIDAALGSYINDIDALIGDVDALLGGDA